MGSCSNRGETHDERIGRFARDILSSKDTSSFEWQTSRGAEIRGAMGVDKGNEFIKAIKKAE